MKHISYCLILAFIPLLFNCCGNTKNTKNDEEIKKPEWIDAKAGVYITNNKKTMYFIGRANCRENKDEARKSAETDAHNQYGAFLSSKVESTILKSCENIRKETDKSIEDATITNFKTNVCRKISGDTSGAIISDVYYQKEIKEDDTICYNCYVRLVTSACEVKHKINNEMEIVAESSTEEFQILKDETKKELIAKDIDENVDDKNIIIKIIPTEAEKELKDKKPKRKINSYSYWITAILPVTNHLYLPYILNPIDDEEYKSGVVGGVASSVGSCGVGGFIGGGIGSVSGVDMGGGGVGGIGGVGGLVGGFVAGGFVAGLSNVNSFGRIISGAAGGSTGFRVAWYTNFLYRIYNNGNRIYIGELLGIAVGVGGGYGIGNIYDTPKEGAIVGASMGLLTGIIADLLTTDSLFPHKYSYVTNPGADEQYYSYDLEKYKKDVMLGILVTEGFIYTANLIGYIIIYNFYNPIDKTQDTDTITFAGFNIEPIFYDKVGMTLIDKGAKGSINFRF